MTALTDVVIESERLRLLPTDESYAPAIFETFTPEVTTYMFSRPPEHIDETLAFIRRARTEMTEGRALEVVVLLRESGEFIGHGGVPRANTEAPELGIWIKTAAHGQHYGREAVTALAGWAAANLRFRYLAYPVDRRNVASRKIPESLGGRIETEYEMGSQSGARLDIVEYRIYPEALARRLRPEA